MAVADILVTKPGGLTSSEALASGVAMVVVNPIPGQESRNSDFLLEAQAAIKANNLGTFSYKVAELLTDPERLAGLRAARAARSPRRGTGRRAKLWHGRPKELRKRRVSRVAFSGRA